MSGKGQGETEIPLDPYLPWTSAYLSFIEMPRPYNAKLQRVVEPADYTVFIGGSSTTTSAVHCTTTP
jgi:hypothetical protein